MRLSTMLFGVTFLLGQTAAALAGPLDLPGLKQFSNAHAAQPVWYLSDDFVPVEDWNDMRLITDTDFHAVSISEPGSRREPGDFRFSMAALSPSVDSTASTTPSRARENEFNRKWTAKHGCEGGPCPTPVPEPATAMLLVVGLGLAGVTARLPRWR